MRTAAVLAGGLAWGTIVGYGLATFLLGHRVAASAPRAVYAVVLGCEALAGLLCMYLALAVVSFNLAWPVQFAAFTLLGLGFYTMHASIQVTATELSSTARGAAMSLHSFFFFVGHASGPVLYGLGFVKLGSAVTLTIAALIALGIGIVTARLLRERASV